MDNRRKIRAAVSLLSFIGIVAPFMFLMGAENTEEAFNENASWVIKNTLVWIVVMSLLLIKNPKFFGDETPFDILLRYAKRLFKSNASDRQ